MRNQLKLIIAIGVFALGGLVFSQSTTAVEKAKAGLRYNQAQWKGSHNSYAQTANIMTQLKDWGIRSIEFDIHAKNSKLEGGAVAPAGDFFVYHTSPKNQVNCHLLSECLEQVSAFHRQEPQHQVVTIFFDMAGIGQPDHTKSDLYALFKNSLPANSIFSPGDLLAGCPSAANLQESVTKSGCGWPWLDDLKGKFILVVSDGREEIGQSYDLHQDLLFLVAKGNNPANLHGDPNLVFFNMAGPKEFITEVKKAGFISRSYWLNSQDKYLKSKRLGANHLATDLIDPKLYPWANIEERP